MSEYKMLRTRKGMYISYTFLKDNKEITKNKFWKEVGNLTEKENEEFKKEFNKEFIIIR